MNQEQLQADIRALTGSASSLNSDWQALFDQAGVPDGSFNQRLLGWIDNQLGTSHGNLNAALGAYAAAYGFGSWTEVTDIVAPSALPGLIAWWDARSLAGLFDGALVDLLADEKGTCHLSATGAARPVLRDGGHHPAGRPYLEFDGSATLFTMAQKTPALGAFTIAWAAADDRVGEFNFLFNDSDGGDILGLQFGDAVYFRGNSITAISGALPRRRPALMAVYTFVYDGAQYRFYVNGELWVQASAATVFAFDRVGGRPSASQHWTGAFGEALVFDRALSDDEREMVETYLSPWRVTALHVDNQTGGDANRGWTPDAAWQTLAKANTAGGLVPGDAILFRRGRIWRGSLFAPVSGTQDAPVRLAAYGDGAPPAIYGSLRHTSGWTLVSGTEYKKTMEAPVNVFRLDGDTVEKLIFTAGGAGALQSGQWAHDGTDLFVNIGEPANGAVFEIPRTAAQGGHYGIAISSDADVAISGISVRFCRTNGIEFFNATRPSATDCESSFNGNDGFNIHHTSDFYIARTVSHRNGQTRTTLGPAGDGYSAHQDCDGLIEDAVATDNEKGGFLHQRPVTVTHRRFFARGNNQNLLIEPQGTPPVDGFTRWENGVVQHTEADNLNAVDLTFPAEMHHVTVVGAGGGVGVHANDKVAMRNCIVAHFATGLMTAGGTAADAHHSLFWANQQDRGPGVPAGQGDGTADPLFAGPESGDFRIREESPAIGAGRASVISEHRDAAGNPVGSRGPVTIGAYQYPVRERSG